MNAISTLVRTAVVLVAIAILATAALARDPSAMNKSVARRVFDEVLSAGRYDVSDELYTKDFVVHGEDRAYSHAEDLAAAKGWRAAFPDLVVTVDQLIAEGDFVVVRWTATGTNSGEGNGLPATGRRVRSTGVTIYRFVDGRIAEEWSAFDRLGAYRQLGLLPATISK